MPSFTDNLARIRVAAATGTIAPDLARWALEELEELAPAAELLDRRNALLRAAGARLGGSTYARSRRLEAELVRARRGARSPDPDGVRELLAQALQLDPSPPGWRQLQRIIGRRSSATDEEAVVEDEIMVYVVDAQGRPCGRHGPVQWSGPLGRGGRIELDLARRGRREYLVLDVARDGAGRRVKVRALG